MTTTTTQPTTSLRTLVDAIGQGHRPGRDVLALTISRAIASLPIDSRPGWSVTPADTEVVLHRALAHVARLAETATASSPTRWAGSTAA